MNHDRRLLVVLNHDRRDTNLIRYAAWLARLNAGADRLLRETEPDPAAPSADLALPVGSAADSGGTLVLTDEGNHILLRAAHAVRFLHVLPPSVREDDSPDGPEVSHQLLARVRAQLADESPPVPFRCDVLNGRAIDRLREAAAEEESDVLLIGEPRRLAARLVREAACSVWLVPDHPPPTIRRILVPVDFTTRSADSLRVAAALARLSGTAECLALHVYFHDCLVPQPEEDRRIRDELSDTYARFLANIDCVGVKVTTLFREGASVPRAILRTAEEQAVDLIVMATRGRTAAGALLGESVAEQTVRISTVPLLVVKHFGARNGMLRILSERAFWQKNDLRFN